MIVFRVDANEQIATGHLMRCLAIAAECRRRGETCLFLLAEEKETYRIRDRGFEYCVLHSRWDQMEEEIPQLQTLLEERGCSWLVVDSYQVTPRYLRILNQQYPVLYLDDIEAEQYDVSAVLHYGVVRQQAEYVSRYRRAGVAALAGTDYIPLREEFQPQHLTELWQGQEARREHGSQLAILLTTGGTDPYHITADVLKSCLARPQFEACHYHVVVGSMNDHVQELQRLAESSDLPEDSQIELHVGVDHMADLMCQCDYAVSAGGTTLYELCACAVPTVCFSFTDNQIPAATLLDQYRVVRYVGDARDQDVPAAVCDALTEYMQQPAETRQYRERMKQLVDGQGVCRIADLLCQR